MRRLALLLLLIPSLAWGAVLFSDTFNRADTSGTLEDASGKGWRDNTANAEISGNHVQCKLTQACNAIGALASNITLGANGFTNGVVAAQTLMAETTATSSNTVGLTCRNQGVGNGRSFYIGYWAGTGTVTNGGYRIDKYVAGAVTLLTTDAGNAGLNSSRLELSCVGNTMSLYSNGVLAQTSVADTVYTSGAVGFYDPSQTTGGAQMFDNFAVCDAVAECDDFSRTGVAAASAPPGGPSGKSLLGVGN